MALFNLLGKEQTKSVSPLSDPFKQDKVETIRIVMNTSVLTGKYWKGYVEFQNGNTGGSFETKKYPVDEFDNCVSEVRELLKTL